jgi:hypothetical protein
VANSEIFSKNFENFPKRGFKEGKRRFTKEEKFVKIKRFETSRSTRRVVPKKTPCVLGSTSAAERTKNLRARNARDARRYFIKKKRRKKIGTARTPSLRRRSKPRSRRVRNRIPLIF